MNEQKILMNPHTGSVDTEENWILEQVCCGNTRDDFADLIEVKKNKEGHWVEA
ncbi:hypothetical protein [Methylobacter svalbardensis]|uniref:hypothetical protein n=1 Tax=Methylobacter svalbardensis TaxID=3080016 RepID=UPI0030EC9639